MKILNFELKSKLDLNFLVEFDGKYGGDSPEPQKPYL